VVSQIIWTGDLGLRGGSWDGRLNEDKSQVVINAYKEAVPEERKVVPYMQLNRAHQLKQGTYASNPP
jgi:hypothetical protein